MKNTSVRVRSKKKLQAVIFCRIIAGLLGNVQASTKQKQTCTKQLQVTTKRIPSKYQATTKRIPSNNQEDTKRLPSE